MVGTVPIKVQGHAELKIEKPIVKTLSYDFPKLQHSKINSFCANVHLRHGPPVPQIWCNSDYYLQSYGILKNMAPVIFL